MTVVVLGSINIDLVVHTLRFPRPGETLNGKTFYTAPGGKGANQAVAASKMGAPTKMIGRVGNDIFANVLSESLKNNMVNVSDVIVDSTHPSGTALITIDDTAENTIIVIPGANGFWGASDLSSLREALGKADILMLQLEIPIEVNLEAAQIASDLNAAIILDPAPVQTIPENLYPLLDIITPNEIETTQLVGFPIQEEDDIKRAAKVLLDRGAKQVIIKLGSKGAFWTNGLDSKFLDPYPVDPVDTVAAGDAFNGALAAGLSEGLEISEALQWAMAAAALSTTKAGAQPSLPGRSSVLKLLSSDNN